MSNFSVYGVTYSSAMLSSYLGRVPTSDRALKEAFREFNVKPTGSSSDLKKLKNAMYEEYSQQVKEQIDNQNAAKNDIPWKGLLAQIGIQATGDYEKDYNAFNDAINLLSQSAVDGQAMAYFAGLRSEASQVFRQANMPAGDQEPISFYTYQYQHLS